MDLFSPRHEHSNVNISFCFPCKEKTKFYKMPLKTSMLNSRATPLLRCRGCSWGQGCDQVAPVVVLVMTVDLLRMGGLRRGVDCSPFLPSEVRL